MPIQVDKIEKGVEIALVGEFQTMPTWNENPLETLVSRGFSWYARQGSNLWPSESESDALSS